MIARLLRTLVPARFRPIGYLEHLVRARNDARVRQGPFQGMRYADRACGSAYIPKILGIYERELNTCVEQAVSLRLPLIVDVGSAEGYYAVGMALRNPEARVIAFEMEPDSRDALRRTVELNDAAARVDVRGKCEPEDLRAALADAERALVICDAEGYEDVLLRPQKIPALARTWLLVETHEFVSVRITERVAARFRETHEVRRITQEPRHRSDFPYRTLGTALLPGRYLDWAVDEWRPETMSWLWMEPKQGHGAAT